MQLTEILGYFLLFLSICGIIAAIWAAGHFSHSKVYSRKLRQERHARREVARASDRTGSAKTS